MDPCPSSGTIGRRRVLSSGIGIAALAAAGCSTQSKPQGASLSGSQAGAQETPKTGGIFNGTIPFNTPLDPQKVSAQPQRSVAGVYSRLFAFKSGTDPKVINNHDIEPDLGLTIESPDATTWTVKLRTDAKFTNIPPVTATRRRGRHQGDVHYAPGSGDWQPKPRSIGMIDPAQIRLRTKNRRLQARFPYAPFNRPGLARLLADRSARGRLTGATTSRKSLSAAGPSCSTVQPRCRLRLQKEPRLLREGPPCRRRPDVAVIPIPRSNWRNSTRAT